MSENDQDQTRDDPKIDELLEKITQSRTALEKDLTDIVHLKDGLKQLFPEQIDYRNKFMLDEKIKAATSFYGAILNIRQEINKTLTGEIEIRRKLNKTDEEQSSVNIRKLAEAIETAGNQRVVFEREKPDPERKIESENKQ